MCAQETNVAGEGKKRSSGFRVIKWLSVVIVLIFILLIFGIPAYLSSSGGKGFVISKVNQSIDGQIEMGDFSVGWFKGVKVSDLSFEDGKGTTSVNVKGISAKPNYGSFLGGNVSLSNVVVDSPDVVFTVKDMGEAAAGKSDKKDSEKISAKKSDEGFSLEELDLTLINGNVEIRQIDQADHVQTLYFKNIASKVDLNKPGKESSFDVSLAVAGEGKESALTAKGQFDRGAKKKWAMSETDGEISVKVDKLDLEMLGPVFVLLGKDVDVKGVLNVAADAEIDDGEIKGLSVDAAIEGFSQVVDGRAISVGEPVVLKADVSSEDGNVKIDELKLKSSFCDITAEGTTKEIDYVAKADIGKTMDFVGSFVDLGGYRFEGQGAETGKISIDGDRIRFSDHSSVDNFVMKKAGKVSPRAVSAKFTFDMTVDTAKQNLTVDHLTMTTADTMADINIYKSVFAWGDKPKTDMKVKADVDLEKAEEFAKFFEAIPEKMGIAGIVKSDLSVQSAGESVRIFTDNTSVTNLKVEAEGAEKPFEDKLVNVTLDMKIDADERDIKFSIDGSQIDVAGKIQQGAAKKKGMARLDGNAVAKYNLEDMSTVASAYMPQGLVVRGKRSDEFKFSSEYPVDEPEKRIANLNASGKLGFESAEYMGMNIGKADVPVKIAGGVLEIEPFSASVNEGKFNFAGSMDMNKKPMVFKTPGPLRIAENIQVNDKMGRELLKYLNPIFAEQAGLTGVADFQCDELVLPLGGVGAARDVRLKGVVAMQDLVMKSRGLLGQILQFARTKPNVYADVLPTKFAMAEGKLSYDNMQINIDKVYPLNFRGQVDVAGEVKRLDMQAALPYKVAFEGLQPKFKTIKIGDDVSDRVVLPIEGTIDNNKIDFKKILDQFLKKGGEDLLRQGIEEGLKELFK